MEEPEPVKINGKEYDYYHVSQQQRKMERDIRVTKREIEAQKAIGGDTVVLQSALRKQTADYKQFSAAAGVKAKNNRLRVESGSSDIKKTSAYARMNKSISKSQERFDTLESYRKGNTHSKSADRIEIIDEATYNKLIRKVI